MQLEKVAPVPSVDLSSKTVIVIRANTGLGLESTIHFAKMGVSRLILAFRNHEKGRKRSSDRLQDSRELLRPQSVLAFVEKFEEDGGRLDILVANAGIGVEADEATKNGWESTIQVNHLSTSFVSLLLIPSLINTVKTYGFQPHFVVVSSGIAFWPPALLAKEVLETKILKTLSSKAYSTGAPSIMRNRYPVSKTLNLFFVRALTAHLGPDSPLIVTAVDSRFCLPEFRNVTFPMSLIWKTLEIGMAHTAEQGSRQLVISAVTQDERARGEFMFNGRIGGHPDLVLRSEGAKIQARIWAETIEILSKFALAKMGVIVAAHLTV